MNMFSASDQILQYPPPLGSSLDGKWKSNVELAPNCPRCASANTKFCYYNNYSLSQPRYFCKGCRRYWTKGGSLRNVPVGGGCRKNRRAKSARRSSENERNTMNYSKSFSSFGDNTNEKTGNACSSDDGDSSPKPSGGSDIDLAVVFAKFLNESSSFEPEFASQELANASNSSTPDSVQNDFATIECQNPSDHHVIGDANLVLDEFPQLFDVVDEKQQEEDRSIQDLLENDMNAYGLQTLLSDEISQDVLWTEQAETFPNFTWQPMSQLHDFDSFPADGTQLKASANLMSDNWSSFDLSGFEVYSRP